MKKNQQKDDNSTIFYKGEEALLKRIGELEKKIESHDAEVQRLKKRLKKEQADREGLEKILRENESKLKTLYKCMPIPTFTWQKAGKDFILIDYNDAARASTEGKIADYLFVKASELYRNQPAILEDMETCFKKKGVIKKEIFYTFQSIDKSGYYDTTFAFISPDLVIVHTEDITKRKQIEKELKDSEERFRQIAEFSPFPISTLDSNGRYLYINKKFIEIFGYTLEDIPTGMDWFDKAFPDPDLRDEVIAYWKKDIESIDNQALIYHTFKVKCKDNSFKYLIFRPVKIEGNIVFITYENITERRIAEDALREREQRLSGIISSITDLMVIIDENFTIKWANAVTNHIFGANIVGKKCYSVFQSKDTLCEPCIVKRVFSDRHIQEQEIEINRPDGKRMVFWFTAGIVARYEDGQPQLVIAVGRDITRRKEMEDKLRETEEKYRSLFEEIPIGLYRSTPDGKIVDVNNSLIQLLGYTDKQSLMAHRTFDTYVNREDRSRLMYLLNQDKVIHNFETQLYKYDGSVIWVKLNVKAVQDSQGKVSHYNGSIIVI